MKNKEEKLYEVAKFSNELNKVPLRGMKLNEKKVFMALLWLVKETDGNEVSIDYNRFIELTQAKPRSIDDGVKLIKSTFRKILTLAITEIRTETDDIEFLFFTSRTVNIETKRVTVEVNPKYAWLVKDIAEAFTSYPLEIGNSFKSEYTMDIYKYFRQYSDTGLWMVTVDDFRKYLAIPASYNLGMMIERIINPAILELKEHYSDVSYEKVFETKKKGQRGRKKVKSLRFTFSKEKHEAWENDKYEKREISVKNKSNVPAWSSVNKPEGYVNTTTPEQIAEMEKKTQELLAKIDKPRDEK